MKSPSTTLLGHLLLGLIRQQPQSGYDLRKLFATTPLGSYSDSPGAIYPALRRLESQGFIQGHEEHSGKRARCVFRITAPGLAQLEAWLTRPVARLDVVRRMDELLARFSFMDGVLGKEGALRFLRDLERELAAYTAELEVFLSREGPDMPISGRLALDSGVHSHQALLRWSRTALETYQRS